MKVKEMKGNERKKKIRKKRKEKKKEKKRKEKKRKEKKKGRKKEREGSKSLFKTKAKKLNLPLGKSSPPGTGCVVPSSGKKSKCKNRSARLQLPGPIGRWPATGSRGWPSCTW